jgi:hypothetical protein
LADVTFCEHRLDGVQGRSLLDLTQSLQAVVIWVMRPPAS